ncbi:hypothetical protein [Humibacter sp. RRB41]|uniref:hypothetical protein n=1 Tax=Humibacter sp. RRB41 TaxID=2919946 RepID=UPI001FA9517B|nr:hypothetical protein [Humibacter sp. RRB41]
MPKTAEELAAEKAAADKAAADKAAAEKAALEASRGFPAETPIEQMTAEQQVAYWKFQARKHENEAKSRADYDDLKTKADELEQLKAANQTEQEKALTDARDEARREGENIGAERYLKDAVMGRFQALTGKSNDDVAKAFAHIDAHSFVDEKGDLNVVALTEFAGTFGPADSSNGTPADPVKAALERQRNGSAAGGSGSGSIAEMRKARLEKLRPASK